MSQEIAMANFDDQSVHTADTAEQESPESGVYSTLGIQPDLYKDPDTAKQAAREHIERLVRYQPATPDYTATDTPPAPETPPAAPEYVEDEDDEDDDTADTEPQKRKRVTKREKALERKIAEFQAREKQREEAQNRQQNERLQQVRTQVNRKAVAAVNSLGSDKYGTDDSRTWSQTQAANNLLQTAERIYKALVSQNRQIPPVEKLVEAAAFYEGVTPSQKQEEPPPEPYSSGRNPAAGATPSGNPAPGSVLPHGKLTSYASDPEFRAAWKSVSRN